MSQNSIVDASTTIWPGELNEVTVPLLRQELNALVAGGCRDLVVDLNRVKSIDAVGLGVLCAAHTTLKREQGALSLVNTSPELYALFHRTGLSRHFTVIPAK